MPLQVKSILKNSVIGYITTRYATMGIQFLNSFFIAAILGPAYLAIWGFINLVLQYAAQINLGIPHSLNVLLSVNKNEEEKMHGYMNAALLAYLLIGTVFFLLLSIYTISDIPVGAKYSFPSYIIPVFFIALLTHFNTLFTNYFRVKNRLREIMFFQSIIPVATLLVLLLVKDKQQLINALLIVMLSGQVVSFFFFVRKLNMKISFKQSMVYPYMEQLLKRGFHLFIYNGCFYFIIISTRTVISTYYDAVEFGYFTFAFTLANAVMLLFDSFSFLIYPKIIHRLNQEDKPQTTYILDIIRNVYIVAIHFIMYSFILIFPFVIKLFPAYGSQFKCFGLIVMTVVFYTNCFVYSSILTARSKEKLLGRIAFISLVLNILFALAIVLLLKLTYEYVILATLLSYIVYNILLSIYTNLLIDIPNTFKTILKENFPLSLFIPFVLCLVSIILELPYFCYWIILFLFILLNWKKIRNLKNIFIKIIKNPTLINI